MTTMQTSSRNKPCKASAAAVTMRLAAASWWSFALLLAATMLFAAGCEHVRKVTYPPGFTYLTEDTVSSSMGEMAHRVARLETLLENVPPGEQVDRYAVIFELRQLENVASRLGAGSTETNHLLIDAHVDRFERVLVQARHAVEREPPNYFLVGQVTGSCSACHIWR